MTEAEQQGQNAQGANGATVWLLSDGTAQQMGWDNALLEAVRERGAERVEFVSLAGAIGLTARNLVEAGAERIRREVRIRTAQGEMNADEQLRSGRPDAIVVDSPGPLRALQMLRDTLPFQPLLIAILPDLSVYHDWSNARPDAWIMASDSLVEQLPVAVSSDSVEVCGPPVSPSFHADIEGSTVRSEAGIDPDVFVIFVDAETMRAEVIETLVAALARTESDPALMFYYGRNDEAADQLRRAASRRKLRANMFGFTPNLARYVAMADIGIVSAANRRLSAYLNVGLPMFAVGATHEFSAAVAEGAMVSLPDASTMRYVVDELVEEGVADAHVQAVSALASRSGVEPVADAISRLLARRTELRDSPGRLTRPTRGGAGGAAGSSGVFEEIGSAGAEVSGGPERRTLSRSEAKRELAELILESRRVEDELQTAFRERDKWLERVDLARTDDDTDLLNFATERLDEARQVAEDLREKMDTITMKKNEVRRSIAESNMRGDRRLRLTAVEAEKSSYEERFRALEMKRDMNRLRQKAGTQGDGEQ